MLIPSCANSTDGSPYSFSKAHLAPLLSEDPHSASRTLTTNQPWVTGVSPDPKSSSCASGTARFSHLETGLLFCSGLPELVDAASVFLLPPVGGVISPAFRPASVGVRDGVGVGE